ncbi:hypothetical protein CFRS1_v012983 [Colletotrichum fructicola]|nr:hypothetical protein CFRS1_v012983 [Colletotrichum fructicola]
MSRQIKFFRPGASMPSRRGRADQDTRNGDAKAIRLKPQVKQIRILGRTQNAGRCTGSVITGRPWCCGCGQKRSLDAGDCTARLLPQIASS